MASDTIHATTTPQRLAAAIAISPPHLAVILHAVRDGSIAFANVKQNSGRFDFVSRRPTVVLIGDDYDQSFGPTAFHRKSVRRALQRVVSAVVVAGAPEVTVYATAVAGAVLTGRDVLLVETTERHEADWVRLIQKKRPQLPTLISTPGRRGGAMH